MKTIGFLAVAAGLFLPFSDAAPALAEPRSETGRQYEIIWSYETSSRHSDGFSSSANGRDIFVERVIGDSEAGLELEYDLPEGTTEEDRRRVWQYPVRILLAPSGAMQLLNAPELEARVDRWLEAAGLDCSACGQWYFTWNAFRIECDPQSVLETIRTLDLRSADLREGAPYQLPEARGPATITRTGAGPDGRTFTAVMEVDPEAVRHARAESDVALSEILQEPVTLEAAREKRAKQDVSGTILVTFETDSAGNPHRRTTVTNLHIRRADGNIETETGTAIVERRRLPTG